MPAKKKVAKRSILIELPEPWMMELTQRAIDSKMSTHDYVVHLLFNPNRQH